MEIEIQLTNLPIAEKISSPKFSGTDGSWLEFRGVVRADENGVTISALEYEAYPEMAECEIRRILESLAASHPCLAVKVVHRIGIINVGETAIYVGVAASHRGEAIALLTEFMNRLKQDVPIWKARALTGDTREAPPSQTRQPVVNQKSGPLSFAEALAQIQSHSQPFPALRAPLAEAFGRVLRETVCAPEDVPSCDRSTRDGYAILQDDSSEIFDVVDTLHAADWKPRQLKAGETVRVATGAALPCEYLRVIMQENAERTDGKMKVVSRENALNIRKRGEEMRAGQALLQAGTTLNEGVMTLLATVGCAQPLVSPLMQVAHFTIGDEIIPPGQPRKPGQIWDSNSILLRGLLQQFQCDVSQGHLQEDFDAAKNQIENFKTKIEDADILLISGGASVGEKDFTRDLLAYLGFKIIFSRLNIRPGAPLIFGVNGRRIAFGLPGNPVSHFVCFHLFVAAALKILNGAEPLKFSRGALTSKLDETPNSRETFVPARLDAIGLRPLKWMSSGDVTCLRETNAIVRIPANRGPMDAGTEVDFLPT